MARTKRPTARTGLARATVLGVILASALTPPGALARTIPAAAPGADAAEGAAVLVGAGDVASCGLTADEATARLLDGISGTVFVVGTGGASLRSFPTVEPNSVVRGTTHGVLRLELVDTGYSWTFVPVAGASFTDSGSGRCH